MQFLLYAAPGTAPPNDCVAEPSPPSSEHKAISGLTAICYVISGDDGAFGFDLLANGRYAVVPRYVGENIRFDVLPPARGFEIRHAHADIPEVFHVEGFTVRG